jgi:hypothetical protein
VPDDGLNLSPVGEEPTAQPQLEDDAFTTNGTFPPAPETEAVEGVSVYEQTDGGAWVTVMVRPATVRVALRGEVSVFAMARIVKVAGDVARPSTNTQEAVLDAANWHPLWPVTLTALVDAVAGNERLDGVIVSLDVSQEFGEAGA